MTEKSHGLRCATLAALLFTAGTSAHAGIPKMALPDGEKFTWGQEPVVATGASRGEVVLNGLWLFQPASGDTPELPWAAIRVPGSWDSQSEWGNMQIPSFVGTPPAWPGASFRIDEDTNHLYLNQTARVWYEREISVPNDWGGRKILLTFERVSTDAEIFINGKKAGEVYWPSGEVDITSAVQPGSTATLRVKVTAVASEKELIIAMREDYADKADGGLRQRGIIGDVVLRSRPPGAHLDGLAIETSVARRELSVSTAVLHLKASAQGKFTATVREWPSGTVAKAFTAESEIIPGRPVVLKWPWADAKLWDIGQPNLYTLSLKVEAAGLLDETAERFGFRELLIDGRNFTLNGTPFFGSSSHGSADLIGGIKEAADAETRRMLATGYNLLEIWPNDTFRRGFADFRAAYARSADEAGIFVLMPLIRPDDVFSWRDKPDEDAHRRWFDANREHVSQVRNSPSVAGYLFFGNEFMTPDDQNPLRIGNTKGLAQSQQQDVSRALELIEELRTLDPTRWIGSHSGAGVGDVHTCNHYLGLTPLQEREETLSHWAENGDTPYGAVEFCTPFSADMHRARMSWNTSSEPLATEFMAGVLGSRAYSEETPEYRKHVRDRLNESKAQFTGKPGGVKSGQFGFVDYPPYFDFLGPQTQRVWRSWRTYGVSLGMIQWEDLLKTDEKGSTKLAPFQPGRRGCYVSEIATRALVATAPDPAKLGTSAAIYLQGIQPLMAYLGGPLDNTDGWVAKDHIFTAGKTVRKSMILLNDGRTPQPYTVKWTANDSAGNPLHANALQGTLGIGDKAFLPIEFPAPDVDDKADLTVKLTANFGPTERALTLTDETSVRILPTLPALKESTPIMIFDPEGKTTAMLHHAGFSPNPWTGGTVTEGTVLAIGRRAMSDAGFDVKAFRAAVRNGAHAVLFQQDPQLLRERGGIRVHHWINRQFWPVETQKDHPLIVGLDENDFRDWTGSGNLLTPRTEDNLSESALRRGYPVYGFRVGARGSVSSAAWEKPHHSGWTPLLEGAFDMAYSPLMELRYGRGYLLNCSLDLEDRAEPLVDVLARRIIQTAAAAKVEPRRAIFYTGNDATSTWLKSSGLVFTELAGAPPVGSLVIAGPGSVLKQARIQTLLAEGTHILLIGQDAATLPAGITAKTAAYGSIPSGPLPDWPELKGISPSDLRLRTDLGVPLIQASPTVQTAADGLLARYGSGPGVMLVFQGTPLALDSAHKLYYRFSEWRWTRALSQILTNMGAAFSADDLLFELAPDPLVPIDLAGDWKVLTEITFPPAPSVAQANIDPGPKIPTASKPDFDDSAWPTVHLPAMDKIGEIDWQTGDGSLWARLKIPIPEEWKNMGDASLVLGPMDDHDTTWFNGTKIGSVGKANTEARNTPRSYRIPAWMIRAGQENTIAIRLFDQFGGGGFGASGTPLSMRLELRKKPERASGYVPGFLTDKHMGDDPARYTRW